MTQCFSVAAVSRGRAPKGLRATKDAINAASETLMENRHAKPRPLPSDGGATSLGGQFSDVKPLPKKFSQTGMCIWSI